MTTATDHLHHADGLWHVDRRPTKCRRPCLFLAYCTLVDSRLRRRSDRVGNVCRANAFIPIDDENCWWYRIRFHQDRPLTEAEILGYREGSFDYAELVPGTYMPRGSRENDYLQRCKQRDGSFTGIPSAQLQDLAIQESQGRIHDRSLEKLVKSDFPAGPMPPNIASPGRRTRGGHHPGGLCKRPPASRQAYATTRPRDQTLEAILDDLGFE
jgi:phthalate 4,5-dioxygenase oxygenase subunit